jgi:rubrerythrin
MPLVVEHMRMNVVASANRGPASLQRFPPRVFFDQLREGADMAMRFEQAGAAATSRRAGGRAKGEFRCTECGYGVVVWDALPTCPMCHGERWEPAPWRPFTRGTETTLDRVPDEADVTL